MLFRSVVVDVRGPDGNAFALMGLAQRLAEQLKIDADPIITDMRSGDYDNLLRVFESKFGAVVTLVGVSDPDEEDDWDDDEDE